MPETADNPRPVARAALAAVLLAYAATTGWLLVTDVWDETRGLQLVRSHTPVELVRTNWTPDPDAPVELFRPLPMVVVTAVGHLAPTWTAAWATLRLLVAAAVAGAALLLLDAVRRLRGADPWRDVALVATVLLSASGVLAAGWFAMAFDAGALLLTAAGLALLARGRPLTAGIALGAAVFCKESALIALPAVAAVVAGRVPRRAAVRAAVVAAGLVALYLAARFVVVPPFSGRDLHAWSVAGIATAALRLPARLGWQLADPPSVVAGWAAFAVLLAGLRSWGSTAAAAATVAVAAVLYGPMVHAGPAPLLDADHFAPRLYALPVAALLLLAVVDGRRWAPLALLLPACVGGGAVALHHREFQRAYQRAYTLAEQAGPAPVEVHCELYRRPFTDRRRGLVLGIFPTARWELRTDGELVDRRRPSDGS